MSASKLTNWLLGALISIVVLVGSLLYTGLTSRMDKLEAKFDILDNRLTAVQIQYGKIDSIQFQLNKIQQDLQALR